MRISVLGAGAWGTALAAAAAAHHEVLLWARDPAQAAAIQSQRCNRRYLSELTLPAALHISADHAQALAFAQGGDSPGLLVIASTMGGLAQRLHALPGDSRVIWLCKGLDAATGEFGHEVAARALPQGRVGVLSGPSFALEVARGQPTALVAASTDADLAALAVQAFHSEHLRVYTCADPVGVEVGGAVKNVMAIATGIADGLKLGLNARAALITRGLAEITRLGLALGAKAETFMGLSGLGDLVLTTTGDLSRNRQVGLLLAAGHDLAGILARLGHVAEGVHTAPMLLARARRLGVEMPITEAVVGVLGGHLTPTQAVPQLMAREARSER